MGVPPPAIQQLARQMLAIEAKRAPSAQRPGDPVRQACERLRLPLTKLAGAAGFSSLMSRALAIAKRQAPSLASLTVAADGSLAGFEELQATAASVPEQYDGEILIAEFLGLLVTFIGSPLTLNLVRQAWPDLSFDSAHPSSEEKP